MSDIHEEDDDAGCISETETEERLLSLLEHACENEIAADFELDIVDVRTFEAIGLLTTDRGVQIELANGQRFFLTIQEDRR